MTGLWSGGRNATFVEVGFSGHLLHNAFDATCTGRSGPQVDLSPEGKTIQSL